MKADGNDPDLVLRPRNDNYRIVIINSVLRTKNSVMSVGGTNVSEPNTVAKITVAVPLLDIASVRASVRAAK